MTGFGRGTAPYRDGQVVVEMRSVNHRFLDIRTRAPRELLAVEAQLERLVRGALARGHCTINLWFERPDGASAVLDRDALKAHIDSLIEVGDEIDLCLADLVPLLPGAPDIYTSPVAAADEDFAAAVETAFAEAAKALLGMRRQEGASMADAIRRLVDGARGLVDQLEGLSREHAGASLERLRERIGALLEGSDLKVDQRRVEAEAALLADKADVNEEIARLRSHTEQLESLLATDGPVGRRLEFLLQEMARETNTIGAKSAAAEIAHLVVDLKAELEKIRELTQNIE